MKSRIAILAAVLYAVTAASSAFGQEDLICGSVERFNQTKRWQDLPGCARYGNYDEENKTKLILAQTKKKFGEFFANWIADTEFGTRSSGLEWEYRTSIQNYLGDSPSPRWQSDPELIAAKPAFDEMKRIVEQHLALKDAYPAIKSLQQNFSTTKYRTQQLVAAGGKDHELSNVHLKALQDDLAKVVAAGVFDSAVITTHEGKTYTLGEIKAETAALTRTNSGAAATFTAAEEAKWRPFKSVLKGDRLAHFDRYKDSYEFRGVGGRILRTPADFRTTPIMAVLSVDDNGVLNRWSVTIWRFAGDKLVGKQTKTGWGSSAPSSAYR